MDDFQSTQIDNSWLPRRTYLITYSQDDLLKFPSIEFGKCIKTHLRLKGRNEQPICNQHWIMGDGMRVSQFLLLIVGKFPRENSHPSNSTPGKFPPRKFPPGIFAPISLSFFTMSSLNTSSINRRGENVECTCTSPQDEKNWYV